MGNIATYSAPGKGTVTYTYDNQGQLLSAAGDTTYTYTYDGAGNILTANGHTYTYGDATWKDLLTAFDGNSISYDAIGNPTSYYNGTRWTMSWTNGRSLATASDGTNSLSFAYDAGGLRTSKTVNGTTYRYYYASGKLMRMTWGTNTIDFFYDANGTPYAMKYNGTVYYYVTNLQGDVMYIMDANQNGVASYEYDPYGKVISAMGILSDVNPLRYRGYVYDQETGFYYLQSRYYDPTIGRFLNTDAFISTTCEILGYDLFTYCHNNPTILADNTGYFSSVALGISLGRGIVEGILSSFLAGYGASNLSSATSDGWFSAVKSTFLSAPVVFVKASEYSTPYSASQAISRKAERTYSVYLLKDEKGIVRYVGRVTDDGFKQRIAYHERTKGLTLYYEVHGLDWPTARGLEEIAMIECHTINPSNPVSNQIHGVGINNSNGEIYFNGVMDYLQNRAEEDLLNLISW